MITKELYSEKYNFKYYHVPKNGITSILRVCINNGIAKNSISSNWVDVSKIPETAPTVCVLREPFSRFISGFEQGRDMLHYYLQHQQVDKNTGIRFGLCREIDDSKLKEIYGNPNQLDGMKILLDEISKNGNLEHHTMKQIDFLNFKGCYYNTDFNLDRDIDNIDFFINHGTMTSDIIKVRPDIILPHLNKKTKGGFSKIGLEIKQDILDVYSDDLKLFEDKILKK